MDVDARSTRNTHPHGSFPPSTSVASSSSQQSTPSASSHPKTTLPARTSNSPAPSTMSGARAEPDSETRGGDAMDLDVETAAGPTPGPGDGQATGNAGRQSGPDNGGIGGAGGSIKGKEKQEDGMDVEEGESSPASVIYPAQLSGRAPPTMSGSHDLFSLFGFRPMYETYVRPYLPDDVDGATNVDGAVVAGPSTGDGTSAGAAGGGRGKKKKIDRYWTGYVADLPGPRQTRKPPQIPQLSLPHLLMNPDPPPALGPNPFPSIDPETLRAGWSLEQGVLEGLDPSTWVPDDAQPKKKKKKKKQDPAASTSAPTTSGAAPSQLNGHPSSHPPTSQPGTATHSPVISRSGTQTPRIIIRNPTVPPPQAQNQVQQAVRGQTAPAGGEGPGSLKRGASAMSASGQGAGGAQESPEHRKKKKRKREGGDSLGTVGA